MTSVLRSPTSTPANNGWTIVGAPTEHQATDDDPRASDDVSSYVQGADTDALELGIAMGADPGFDTGVVLRTRMRRQGTPDVDVDTGLLAEPLVRLTLLHAGVALRVMSHVLDGSAWKTWGDGIPTSVVAEITNWGALSVVIEVVGGAGFDPVTVQLSALGLTIAQPLGTGTRRLLGRSAGARALLARTGGASRLLGVSR